MCMHVYGDLLFLGKCMLAAWQALQHHQVSSESHVKHFLQDKSQVLCRTLQLPPMAIAPATTTDAVSVPALRVTRQAFLWPTPWSHQPAAASAPPMVRRAVGVAMLAKPRPRHPLNSKHVARPTQHWTLSMATLKKTPNLRPMLRNGGGLKSYASFATG